MVRINITSPRNLADQHLIAEYNEILMLVGYARKHPGIKCVPARYCLGKGHITFFKNKLLYLAKRHEEIKKEMKRRGFKPRKSISLKRFKKYLLNDWKPCAPDQKVIKRRLIEKLSKKSDFYRYYGEKKPVGFFIRLLK